MLIRRLKLAPFVEYFYEHNILYIHMSTNALNAHFKIFVQLSLNLETIYNYSTFVVLLNLITGFCNEKSFSWNVPKKFPITTGKNYLEMIVVSSSWCLGNWFFKLDTFKSFQGTWSEILKSNASLLQHTVESWDENFEHLIFQNSQLHNT